MKFYTAGEKEAEYPDTAEELLKRIQHDAIRSKKIACDYFISYFEKGGEVTHPLLGDLHEFRKKMQQEWNFPLHGVNSVAATIEECLDARADANPRFAK